MEYQEVLDGDTIKINNKKIRFSGIDAPEMKQICGKKQMLFERKKIHSVEILQKQSLRKKIKNNPVFCKTEKR